MKQLVGLLVVLGNVSILMEAEDFWMGCDGEVPEVLDIGLERKSSVGTVRFPGVPQIIQGLARPTSRHTHTE